LAPCSMKFGRYLDSQRVSGWEHHYVRYNELKKFLKNDSVSAGDFSVHVQEEMVRVSKFFSHLTEVQMMNVESVTQRVRASPSADLVDDVLACAQEVDQLRQFAVLNYLAIRKIVKKHDKRATEALDASLMAQLVEQPFCQGAGLVALVNATEALVLAAGPDFGLVDGEHVWTQDILSNCTICLQRLCNPVALGCGHKYCYNCLVKAASFSLQACPLCRSEQVLDPRCVQVQRLAQILGRHPAPPWIPSTRLVLEEDETKLPCKEGDDCCGGKLFDLDQEFDTDLWSLPPGAADPVAVSSPAPLLSPAPSFEANLGLGAAQLTPGMEGAELETSAPPVSAWVPPRKTAPLLLAPQAHARDSTTMTTTVEADGEGTAVSKRRKSVTDDNDIERKAARNREYQARSRQKKKARASVVEATMDQLKAENDSLREQNRLLSERLLYCSHCSWCTRGAAAALPVSMFSASGLRLPVGTFPGPGSVMPHVPSSVQACGL